MTDQPEVDENAAPPKTLGELLRRTNLLQLQLVVDAVAKAFAPNSIDVSDDCFAVKFVKSEDAVRRVLIESGELAPQYAPSAAECPWAELVKWDPWKDRAFDPVSQIMCCCVPRALFAFSVVTASTCRLCPRVCCCLMNLRGRRDATKE